MNLDASNDLDRSVVKPCVFPDWSRQRIFPQKHPVWWLGISQLGQKPKPWRLKVMSALASTADIVRRDRKEGRALLPSLSIPRLQGMPWSRSAYLPDGQITEFPVQPSCEKYSAFPVGQIISTSSPRPVPLEGRCATSSTRGGMRWTRMALRRGCLKRTAKACGPDAPTLASSLRRHPQATVANKPGHRGEHEVAC